MPNWEQIRKTFETTELSYTQIAKKYDVKVPTIKSRKKRESWERMQPVDATSSKSANRMQPDSEEPEVRGESILTEKQQLFCKYYINSFNGTLAAKKAGYSPHSAHVAASTLLSNPKVRDEIKKLKGIIQKDLMVGPMDIVAAQLKIAFADVTDYVKFGKRDEPIIDEETGEPLRYKNGKIKRRIYNYVEFEDYEKVDGTIITEVKQGKDGISVKLADRSKALDFLTKYFDMIPDEYKDRILELKTEEMALRKLEIEQRDAPMQKPDISAYVDALRGSLEDVFSDEED